MGVFRRLERGLEGLVTGTFARVFRSAVQPVEIASALQRELDNSAQVLSRDASLVPNDFTVELSSTDYDRLAPYAHTLTRELVDVVNRHASAQRYTFTGPVTVAFERREDLTTGRFRIRSSAVASIVPSRRPSPPPPEPSPRYGAGHYGHAPGYASVPPPAPGPRPVPRTRPDLHRPMPPYLEVNGQRHPLEPPGVILGRGTDADLRITDPGVSRRHAEIRVSLDGPQYTVTIHDLGSTNGIVVDGRRVEYAALHDGSQILLGNTLLVLRRPGGEH
ncbi:FhaA domain-containing protein [Thermasporomyces composti]|uniref:FHA domain-containing protein n=1 Tax=Thermasporomyces composti TaxID=696763 RepID=A0A3D9V569_THECX|nr:DUF3662 and FHA domain-containing protein [Thermasporomyces composti]REF36516.1 FHA domain-containing protein [Thermasporomyces composti]